MSPKGYAKRLIAKQSLATLLQVLSLGVLLQMTRGVFTMSLLPSLQETDVTLTHAAYSVSFMLCGLTLFFSEKSFERIKHMPSVALCFGTGMLGIGLIALGPVWLSCCGAVFLAIFVSLSTAKTCESLVNQGVARAFLCLTMGFLLSFAVSFVSEVSGMLQIILLTTIPIIVCMSLLVNSSVSTPKRKIYFDERPTIPGSFFLTLILLCLMGTFLVGIVSASGIEGGTTGPGLDTVLSFCIALALFILLKLGIKARNLVYWCWFTVSLCMLLGVVMLVMPSAAWINLGADIITLFRVVIEYLLLAMVIMVATREGLQPAGLAGLLYLLPLGASVLLRYVAAPLIGQLLDDKLTSYLPAFVLLVCLLALFFQYAAGNRGTFDHYFKPPVDDVSQSRTKVLDTIAKGNGLTPREREVLDYIAQGYTMKAISERLFVSMNTVRAHSKALYQKLNMHSKQEIIDYITNRLDAM